MECEDNCANFTYIFQSCEVEVGQSSTKLKGPAGHQHQDRT